MVRKLLLGNDFKMFGKKGLSAVVATVSLVLLTFVAVAIISSYVIPLVRNSLNEGTACISYSDYFVFEEEFGYNCYKSVSGYWLYAISVGAGSISEESESNVVGLRLSFIDSSSESKVIDIEEGSDDYGGSVGQIRKINVSELPEIPGSGEVRTYVYNSSEKLKSVRVAPKIKPDRVCPKSDSIKIERTICQGTLSVT